MKVTIEVEDQLKEVLDQPGNALAAETAYRKRLMELRDAYYEKLSRQSVMSRGFIGTSKQ
jgi:hypothetical protein